MNFIIQKYYETNVTFAKVYGVVLTGITGEEYASIQNHPVFSFYESI